MQGVLQGFATIGTIIGLGYLLAHIRILDLDAQLLLSRLAFFVASPALMVTVLAGTDVAEVFSRSLAASAAAVVITAVLYVVPARLLWRKDTGDAVVGTLCSVYVNAGNLGLPIAAYVLGDAALIAPVLLMQMLVLQPVALAVLDTSNLGPGDPSPSVGRLLTSPFRNPLTIGSIIGLLVALTGVTIPRPIFDPLDLIGGMAVPAMLLAYGVSLKLGPRPGAGASPVEIGYISVLKLVVQPTAAYLVARFALGLDDLELFAVTVMAALPTAQNIFVHATRYDRATIVARDAIFVTTLLSVPALFVIAALLA